MGVLAAILLGAVQGLTEFLPVSSSAHLILARMLFGVDAERLGMAFDVACHVGTLVAVVAFFRQDLIAMAVAVPGVFQRAPDRAARRLQLVVVGTLPVMDTPRSARSSAPTATMARAVTISARGSFGAR